MVAITCLSGVNYYIQHVICNKIFDIFILKGASLWAVTYVTILGELDATPLPSGRYHCVTLSAKSYYVFLGTGITY